MTLIPRLVGRGLNTASRFSPRLAGAVAFALMAYPGRRAPVRNTERAVHEQARRETVPVAGRRVAVYRWGEGARPVLLLHGWGLRASRFASLVPALTAAGFSPVAFDAPGHGRSPGRSTHVPEYVGLAGELAQRYGPVEAVVGHSLGGLAALLAAQGPVAAKRLVTIGSPAGFGHFPGAFAGYLGVGAEVRRQLRERLDSFLAAQPPAPSYADPLSVDWQPSPLPLPMLLVHDADDPVVAVEHAHRLARLLGGDARLLLTERLGHHRVLADPQVVSEVVEFLRR